MFFRSFLQYLIVNRITCMKSTKHLFILKHSTFSYKLNNNNCNLIFGEIIRYHSCFFFVHDFFDAVGSSFLGSLAFSDGFYAFELPKTIARLFSSFLKDISPRSPPNHLRNQYKHKHRG